MLYVLLKYHVHLAFVQQTIATPFKMWISHKNPQPVVPTVPYPSMQIENLQEKQKNSKAKGIIVKQS